MGLTPFPSAGKQLEKVLEFIPCEELRELLIFTDIIDLFHKEELFKID